MKAYQARMVVKSRGGLTSSFPHDITTAAVFSPSPDDLAQVERARRQLHAGPAIVKRRGRIIDECARKVAPVAKAAPPTPDEKPARDSGAPARLRAYLRLLPD